MQDADATYGTSRQTTASTGGPLQGLVDLIARVLARLGLLPDDAIVERLSLVRGIGRWTAEMFLIFQLGRLDVWPVDDLGVRKGYQIAYGLQELPKPKVLLALGERFRPYRTIAAWYCWQTVHLSRDLPIG